MRLAYTQPFTFTISKSGVGREPLAIRRINLILNEQVNFLLDLS